MRVFTEFILFIFFGICFTRNLNLEVKSRLYFNSILSDVVIKDKFAYVAISGFQGGLNIYDVSNSSNPILKGVFSEGNTYIQSVSVEENFAYILDFKNGLVIVDISDTSKPKLVGKYPFENGYKVVVAKPFFYDIVYVMLDKELKIIDVKDKSNPKEIGNYLNETPNTNFRGIYVVNGKTAYLTNQNNLLIVNVTDSSNPVLISESDRLGMASDVQVVGNFALTACWSKVTIHDIFTGTPVLVGNFTTSSSVALEIYSSMYSPEVGFVADQNFGLLVYDLSPPINKKGSLELPNPRNLAFRKYSDYTIICICVKDGLAIVELREED